jgi:hypothetical protein
MTPFFAYDPLLDAFESMHSLWVIPVIGIIITGLAWYLGREFLLRSPTTPCEIDEQAVHPALSGLTMDRRATPRREGQETEVWIAEDCAAVPCLAYVRNRSIGGLCLSAPQPFAEGSLIKVKPRHGPEPGLWISMIVRKCRPHRGSWELGCQFEKTPSYNVLLLFG